jgi:tRNA pseudouridine38-40 synthase
MAHSPPLAMCVMAWSDSHEALLGDTMECCAFTRARRGFSNKAAKSAAAVAASGYGERSTVRTVRSIALRRHTGGSSSSGGGGGDGVSTSGYLDIDFVLDGALYKMVRRLVGAAVAVAAGRVEVDVVRESLRRREWAGSGADTSAAAAAPACGLTLERVYYDDGENEPRV